MKTDIKENKELLFIEDSKKKTIFAFWMLCYAIVSIWIAQKLIAWNSWQELLLSLSVGITLMVAVAACFYAPKKTPAVAH